MQRASLFKALTRPQMIFGVTYTFFVFNAVVALELFLLTKSFWAFGVAGVGHALGVLACAREPRIFDLWLSKVQHCPRNREYRRWRCNSYEA